MTRFYLKHAETGCFLTWNTAGGQALRYSFDTVELAAAAAPAGYTAVELAV